jgi:hypothetical protein
MNRMNLARHISVLWRFRAIVGLGLILGIAMAFLAAYKVPSMERRGVEKWSAESSIFVTQEGFPWGRVTLGDATAPGMPSASTDGNDGSKTPFADPARFANLALVYSNLVQSDEVRGVLPGHPTRDQIEPRVLDATGGGVSFLPIIKLTVFEGSANGAVNLNRKAIAALRDYIERNQQHTNPPTPANERIRLEILNEPTGATLVSGHSLSIPLLAFLLCLLGAVAIAHIMENLRPREQPTGVMPEDFDPELYVSGEPYEPPVAEEHPHMNGHAAASLEARQSRHG